jgi:putative oxidoreductase
MRWFRPVGRHFDAGLLFLRLGLGAMFIYHGAPKLAGGAALWQQLGAAMGYLGIHFLPTFWGFMAAVAEFGGGLLLLAGLLFAPACLLLAFDMVVAALMHLGQGQGLPVASQPIELAIVFVALALIGPGRFSLDRSLAGRTGGGRRFRGEMVFQSRAKEGEGEGNSNP